MKPLDKLTELLCENERVNEDIKELKFGCKQYMNGKLMTYICENGNWDWYSDGEYCHNLGYKNYDEEGEIIGNPLLERHLKMYCKDEGLYYYARFTGDIIIENKLGDIISFTLDNTKDLYEQSDSVIERILDFLIKSKQGIK